MYIIYYYYYVRGYGYYTTFFLYDLSLYVVVVEIIVERNPRENVLAPSFYLETKYHTYFPRVLPNSTMFV